MYMKITDPLPMTRSKRVKIADPWPYPTRWKSLTQWLKSLYPVTHFQLCQQRFMWTDVQWKNGSQWVVPSSCCNPNFTVKVCQDEARTGNSTESLYTEVLTLFFTILIMQLNTVDHDMH